MSDPWKPAKPRNFYLHGLDFRIEDKLDRLREAVLALADLNPELGYRVRGIRLQDAIDNLQTAEERDEHND